MNARLRGSRGFPIVGTVTQVARKTAVRMSLAWIHDRPAPSHALPSSAAPQHGRRASGALLGSAKHQRTQPLGVLGDQLLAVLVKVSIEIHHLLAHLARDPIRNVL